MKIRLFFVSFIFIMILFVSNVFAEVTIHGHVYYWNLEQGINAKKDTKPEDIQGGRYLPARRLLLEIEFLSPLTFDEQTYTDDSGYYEVTHINPLIGDCHVVDVEVRAEVKLATINGERVFANCYEGAFGIFSYNGQTGYRSVGEDETITFNVYIGGPQNNIEEWDVEWDVEWDNDEDGEGRDHLVAFFMCQVILDAFNWLEERAPEREEFERNTSLFYPKDTDVTHYNAFLSPPGTAWIDVKEGFYYPDEISEIIIRNNSNTVSQRWQGLRSTITHEYGHKIMHDVYWTLAKPLKFWESSSHTICTTKSPEFGWKEGWAEFFAAAVLNWPTINGLKSDLSSLPFDRKEAYNIEHVYYPYTKEIYPINSPSEIVPLFDFTGIGNFNWRDCVSDDKRYMNEGENASVLWDIYDPKGWEYLSQERQEEKPVDWPTPLKWYDRLEDPNFEHIWEMIARYREYGPIGVRRVPDCLIDEGDVWEDSFWYYWKDKDDGYGNEPELMHGLKAVMYNRGITSTDYAEHSPEVIIKQVNQPNIENQKIEIEVTEEDTEDQPYLYYNLVYCTGSGENSQVNIVFDKDQPLDGNWENNTLSFSIDVPPFQQWKKLIVMVHDSMLCSFATYENDLFVEQDEGVSVISPYFYLEEKSFFQWGYSDKLKVVEGYAYIVSGLRGLGIIDISNPEEPKEVGIYRSSNFTAHCQGVEIIDRIEESGEKKRYALVAYGSEGLRVVDISHPDNPIEVSSFKKVIRGYPGGKKLHPWAVVSDGKYAYVAGGPAGLSIIDISNLNNLVEVAYFATSKKQPGMYICDVAIMGDYAYLADKYFGLCIIKISDLDEHEPEMVGSFATGTAGLAKKVERIIEVEGKDKKNRYAFVVNFSNDLCMIDVTDPGNPFEIFTFKKEGRTHAVDIKGKYVFVGGSKGLYVLDITDPTEPEEVRIYDESESDYCKWRRWGVVDIAIYNDFIFPLYNGSFNILSGVYKDHKPDFVLDIEIEEKEQQVEPVQQITISGEVFSKPYFSPMDIAVKGDYVYIAECFKLENYKWIGGGLRVWDISERLKPKEVGFCDTPTGTAVSVSLSNNLAYVGHSYGHFLQIVDIANPLNPFYLGGCDNGPDYILHCAMQIMIREDLAYIATAGGLWILHIMNPEYPIVLSYIKNHWAKQMILSGSLLYLLTSRGIKIYNIADPVSPEEMGIYDLKGLYPRSMQKKDNFLFLACGHDGLQIVDITDLVHPQKVSSCKLIKYTEKICLQGNYAYIWGDILKIVDISNPSLPVEVGSYQHPDGIKSLAVTEDSKYLYLIDFKKNIVILQMS